MAMKIIFIIFAAASLMPGIVYSREDCGEVCMYFDPTVKHHDWDSFPCDCGPLMMPMTTLDTNDFHGEGVEGFYTLHPDYAGGDWGPEAIFVEYIPDDEDPWLDEAHIHDAESMYAPDGLDAMPPSDSYGDIKPWMGRFTWGHHGRYWAIGDGRVWHPRRPTAISYQSYSGYGIIRGQYGTNIREEFNHDTEEWEQHVVVMGARESNPSSSIELVRYVKGPQVKELVFTVQPPDVLHEDVFVPSPELALMDMSTGEVVTDANTTVYGKLYEYEQQGTMFHLTPEPNPTMDLTGGTLMWTGLGVRAQTNTYQMRAVTQYEGEEYVVWSEPFEVDNFPEIMDVNIVDQEGNYVPMDEFVETIMEQFQFVDDQGLEYDFGDVFMGAFFKHDEYGTRPFLGDIDDTLMSIYAALTHLAHPDYTDIYEESILYKLKELLQVEVEDPEEPGDPITVGGFQRISEQLESVEESLRVEVQQDDGQGGTETVEKPGMQAIVDILMAEGEEFQEPEDPEDIEAEIESDLAEIEGDLGDIESALPGSYPEDGGPLGGAAQAVYDGAVEKIDDAGDGVGAVESAHDDARSGILSWITGERDHWLGLVSIPSLGTANYVNLSVPPALSNNMFGEDRTAEVEIDLSGWVVGFVRQLQLYVLLFVSAFGFYKIVIWGFG